MRRRFFLIAALPFATISALAAELDINTASQARLEQLAGIGPPLAERILAARAEAPFADWADLRRRVKGIGPKLAAKLSEQGLRINGQALPPAAASPPPDPPSAPAPAS